MVPYVLCIVGSWLLAICYKLNRRKEFFYIYILGLTIFFCFGYTTGSDWRNYELMYETVGTELFEKTYIIEPGYYFYMLFFKSLGFSFWPFFCLTKTVSFLLLVKLLTNYCAKYKYVAISFFISCFALYLYIDNPMRNLIAITLSCFAIKALMQDRKLLFFTISIICISFHVSSVILLLIYWMRDRHFSTIGYIVMLLTAFVVTDAYFVTKIVSMLSMNIPYLEMKMMNYIMGEQEETRLFSLGLLVQLLLFCLILLKRKEIESETNGSFFLNLSIAYILLYKMSLSFEVFSRLLYFFVVPYIIVLIFIYKNFHYKSKLTFYCCLMLFSFYMSFSRITSDYRYVPYTNYLTYFITGTEMSYQERYYFNQTNSPFK